MSRRPPRKRELSEDEQRLWEQAMRETRALNKQDRGGESQARAERTAPDPSQTGPSASNSAGSMRGTAASRRLASAKPPATGAHGQGGDGQGGKAAPTPLARRESRRIVRDPETIDARLDLHGMRQREAYPALKAFLRAAQARDFRLVLIITGKGSVRDTRAAEDAGNRHEPPFYESPRGVLRRLVPDWLAKPEFRDAVASISPAHPRHGGEGALYVRLRRASRPSPRDRRE